MTGIEPASSAWEADILPMNYICKIVSSYHDAVTLSISNGEIKRDSFSNKLRFFSKNGKEMYFSIDTCHVSCIIELFRNTKF